MEYELVDAGMTAFVVSDGEAYYLRLTGAELAREIPSKPYLWYVMMTD